MRFLRRAPRAARRVGVFPGTFNPVTVAHMALAGAALASVDEVVFVLPRKFPHKTYEGATFTERARMLLAAIGENDAFYLAATSRGLYIDIAAECRDAYGPGVTLAILCGRDAAERIANWDYGRPGVFQGMLRDFELLVADRAGRFEHPGAGEIVLPPEFEAVSASEVRGRISRGEDWERLVPQAAWSLARQSYGGQGSALITREKQQGS